jgi:hypothetical protein
LRLNLSQPHALPSGAKGVSNPTAALGVSPFTLLSTDQDTP